MLFLSYYFNKKWFGLNSLNENIPKLTAGEVIRFAHLDKISKWKILLNYILKEALLLRDFKVLALIDLKFVFNKN